MAKPVVYNPTTKKHETVEKIPLANIDYDLTAINNEIKKLSDTAKNLSAKVDNITSSVEQPNQQVSKPKIQYILDNIFSGACNQGQKLVVSEIEGIETNGLFYDSFISLYLAPNAEVGIDTNNVVNLTVYVPNNVSPNVAIGFRTTFNNWDVSGHIKVQENGSVILVPWLNSYVIRKIGFIKNAPINNNTQMKLKLKVA